MSQCIGICQIDEFGYCVGCGRSEAEINGEEPQPPEAPATLIPAPAPPAGNVPGGMESTPGTASN